MVHEYSRKTDLHELHAALARAELDHQISEFQALIGRAILAMIEESEFVNDYLDMAEAVAASKHERSVIAQARATLDWLRVEACLRSSERPIRPTPVPGGVPDRAAG